MATQIGRFKGVDNGDMRIIGNTLGLSKAEGLNEPGTVYSIGAFTSIDTSLTASGGWPAGTTLDWTQNSSSAELNLPSGAEVLYAELVWSGCSLSRSTSPNQDVSANLGDAINFTDPTGKVNSISPDPETIIDYDLSNRYKNNIGTKMYTRSANVTDIIKSAGNGTYTVGKVPGTVDPLNDLNQYCGWSMAIAYKLSGEKLRYLDIEISAIQGGDPPTTISGFQTPTSGKVNAKIFFAIGGGSVGFQVENDAIAFAGTPVSTPNNPNPNFACSQINDENGNLVTTGTFGTRNADPVTNTQVEAGRQGWDITAVDISSILKNDQSSIAFDVFLSPSYSGYPVGDDYGICIIAYSIDAAIADIVLTKTPSSEGIEPGDNIVYTIEIDNTTGSLDANNVVLTDTIPPGSTFVDGSVSVNSTPVPGANPQNGINIGDVAKGTSTTVEFTVNVATIPNPNTIDNNASIIYTYISSGVQVDGKADSNSVSTVVGLANFSDNGLVKSVDKEFATIGDTITYTFAMTNTGNVDAINCIMIDTLASGVTFVPSSLTGGTGDPSSGINIGTIASGASANISFQVTVDTIPNPNPIVNSSLLNYEFSLSPNEPNKTGQIISNDVTTEIKYVDINPDDGSLLKEQDKDTVALGDTLTYTITVKNTGNADIAAKVTDIVPVGTEFVPGSVTVNGSPNTGDPNTGIDAGNISAGQSSSVSFKVNILQLPSSGTIVNKATIDYSYIVDPAQPPVEKSADTNEVTTSVLSADLSGITKSVDKAYADIADEIEYTITLPNAGNADAINVVIMDTIASTGVSFVPGSIVGGSGSPSTGINVGTIAKGQTATVKFKVVVDQIPDPNPIVNSAVVNYEYSVGTSVNKLQNISNEVSTQVNHGGFDGGTGDNFVKSADKDVVKVGDTLTYTITMNNVGNVDLIDVMVKDALSSDVSFVDGSATVNGAPSIDNPNTGIKVGVVPASSSVVVKFAVKVNAIPTSGVLKNSASTTYSYYVDPNGPPKTGSDDTNEISTKVEKVEIEMIKSADKKAVVSGMTITYTIIVNNKGTVSLENAIIKDQIPPQTQYVEGSVRINGAPSSESILNGIKIPNLNPGQSTNISFDVLVL